MPKDVAFGKILSITSNHTGETENVWQTMRKTTVTLRILGMTCTMCALTIERQLLGQRGVATATINFALGKLR